MVKKESQDERGARERAYDDEIAPLMTKIIEACKRAEIPFAAQFSIGPSPEGEDPWLCTSALTFDDAQIRRVLDAMTPRPSFVAITITSGERDD